jgi:hypothetical protein
MLRRPIAAILLATTIPQLNGCAVHSTQRLRPSEVQLPGRSQPGGPVTGEHIVGVTTSDGSEVELVDSPRAYVANDTLYALETKMGQPFKIAVRDVQRVWLQRTDLGLSALATIGVAVAVVGVLGVIALATKESCPFVYSWDGTRYVFDAEPYGGATTRGLERDDWAALEHLRPVGGEYRLMVTNEVNETQFTNLMELLAVDHRTGVQVIADEHGGLHTVAAPQPPRAARDRDGRDLLPWLGRTDHLIWEPDAVPDGAGTLRQEVTLTFPKPAGASTAKLVANVATGLWGSHMIRAMLELWGRDVGEWYTAIDTRPSARDSLLAWNLREEIFTLKVYVEEPSGWQVRGVLEGGGPFIAEDRVVPLEVSRVPGDSVRIRLRPPIGFWALNSFAMDYSADRALLVDTLPLVEAGDSGRSVRSELVASDSSYFVMPDKGDHAWLTFRAPPARPGLERTVLLHSRGYYRLHLDATGPADTATLRRITVEPGAVARFAAERFGQWQLARQRHP